jgi:hypothetical protein
VTAFFAFALVLGTVLLAGSLLLVRGRPHAALALASFFTPGFGVGGLASIALGGGNTTSLASGVAVGSVLAVSIAIARRRG